MVVIVISVDGRDSGLRFRLLRHQIMALCGGACSAPIRPPLGTHSAFLALRVLAIMKAVTRTSPTGSLLITLLACFLTICASVFNLATLWLLRARRVRDIWIGIIHHW